MLKLLDSADDQAWVRHVAGASALMKLRGPQRYQTDFEKALFLAQAGPIVSIPNIIRDENQGMLTHSLVHGSFDER